LRVDLGGDPAVRRDRFCRDLMELHWCRSGMLSGVVVDERFVDRWAGRLRREVPEAVAVLLGGSHARGDAGPHSDVDFDVLVPEGPRDEGLAWFEVAGERLV